MTTTLQTNIKKQLHAKNMTAAELERRTGIPHAVINILHGRSKNPSIRTAQAIAKELGCSVEELINDASEQIQPAQQAWDADLYLQATQAVCNYINKLNLNPTADLVSACIIEVYNYCSQSPQKVIEQRFVQWMVDKTFKTL